MPQDDVDVGLSNGQIMQRYLARHIYHEFELRITDVNDHQTVGFITGFDDRCIQMSTTPTSPDDEPRSTLIFWPVRRIEETGSRLDCLSPDVRKKIRLSTRMLRRQCESAMNTNGASRSNSVPSGLGVAVG